MGRRQLRRYGERFHTARGAWIGAACARRTHTLRVESGNRDTTRRVRQTLSVSPDGTKHHVHILMASLYLACVFRIFREILEMRDED